MKAQEDMQNSVGNCLTYLNEFTLGKFTFTCNVYVHYMNLHWDRL